MDEELYPSSEEREELPDEEPQTSEPAGSDEKDGKSVSADLIRGHINTIILRALADGDKYGYEIIADIEQKSHGQYSLKQPSLYSALKRLETQGYVTSYWGGSVGGGRRKYFSLTDEGVKITEQNRSEWEYSRTIIDSLISDKDFDFSNPAPSLVNMRVLKSTTSRVPSKGGGEDEELDYEPTFVISPQSQEELEALKAQLAEKEREIQELKTAGEEERARLEEETKNLRERLEAALYDKQTQEENFALRERTYEERLAERDRILGEERARTEIYLKEQSAETEAAYLDQIQLRESALQKERERYELLLTERDAQLEEEREAHRRELEEREAAIYKKLHDEMQHQSYLNLVNTPPPAPEPAEYGYYTAPVAEEEAPKKREETDETEYRTVVRKMYESTVQHEEPNGKETLRAQPLDGVNFRDVEERAAADGIRVTTAGKKTTETVAERSASVVHKGKALFLSALVAFVLCLIEGGIVLALQERFALPVYFPYFIWGIGLAALLITGLAYANGYGERALRRSSPALINAVVVYALTVIFTLIIALGVNIDFTSPSALASYVVIPVVFLFGIVVFGVVYWIQVRPKRD